MNKPITIPRTLANRLLTLAQLAPELEVCGLISKQNTNNYKIHPITNIAKNSSCVFEMDPQQQIKAFKEIREKHFELFAIYHSHPSSEAIPSKKDLNELAYPDVLNIIISLSTQGVLDMRGYFYPHGKAESVDLIID